MTSHTLRDGDLEATFVPGAGMIGSSLRHRGEELLVQRGGLDAWRGRGKSFGLPLLHPWANRLPDWRYAAAGRAVSIDRARGTVRPDENGLPIHGALAAAEDWDVLAADDTRLTAALDYGRRDDRLAAFPFPHRLELDIGLGDGALTVKTTVTPTTDQAVPIAFGWHPWFGLPGAPRAEWELRLPPREAIALDARNLPTGERAAAEAEAAPLGARVLDDLSAVAEDAELAVAGGGREIAVQLAGGYRFAQVYAPDTPETVCLEPMMAPIGALASGEELPLAESGAAVAGVFRVRVT
jgi:aldose 1-epimerase